MALNMQGNNMLFEFEMKAGSDEENVSNDILSSISDLSQEILLIVFSYLPIEDLSRLARVNSEWLFVTQDKALWVPYGIKKGLLAKKPKLNADDEDEYEDLNEQTKAKCVDTRVVERNWEKERYYVQSFQGHIESIRSVSYSDDMLVSTSEDGTAKLWSISSGKCLRTIYGHQGHENSVTTLQFDQLKVVSGSTDKSIRVWDINTGQSVSTLLGHNDSITDLQFSGNEIYSSSADHTVKVWDIRIGDTVNDLIGHKNSVNSLKMDVKTKRVYTASSDLTIGVWDMANLHDPHFLDGHVWHVHAIDVVDDKIISASGDKSVRVWNTKTEKCTSIMRDHFKQSIVSLKADSRKIVAGSYDKNVKIFHFGKPFC